MTTWRSAIIDILPLPQHSKHHLLDVPRLTFIQELENVSFTDRAVVMWLSSNPYGLHRSSAQVASLHPLSFATRIMLARLIHTADLLSEEPVAFMHQDLIR